MTSQYRAVDLMRRRHASLAVTITAAVLGAEIAQPVMATHRGRTTLEIANGRGHGVGGPAFDPPMKSFFYKHLKQGASR